MQLIIQNKGIELTDHLHEYVEKKLGKLDRYLSTITETRVELSTEKARSSEDRQIVQVTVRANRAILRAEERANDIFIAIDAVLDKIKRQIDRYKNRQRSIRRGMAATEPSEQEAPEEEEAQEDIEQGSIVRIKRFPVTPMNPEEAIEQMELLGHNFFVFYNVDEGQINVIYARRDGNYGLLQPEA